jgi:hypothetical protein
MSFTVRALATSAQRRGTWLAVFGVGAPGRPHPGVASAPTARHLPGIDPYPAGIDPRRLSTRKNLGIMSRGGSDPADLAGAGRTGILACSSPEPAPNRSRPFSPKLTLTCSTHAESSAAPWRRTGTSCPR